MMEQGNAIETKDLAVGYGAKVILHPLTFSVRQGEMVCMLGRNGCGKSTLLRTLAGLQPALGGSFAVGDVAVVLTDRLALDNTSVWEVVAMGRYPYTSFLGGLSQEDERIVEEAMRSVGIASPDVDFSALSDGEKQRVLIAKALAQQTAVILLDEPTAHLDLPNRVLVLRLLRRLAHEQGKTVLISTHELELALHLSDRILLISESGIALDTAENLRKQDAFTKAFNMNIFDLSTL